MYNNTQSTPRRGTTEGNPVSDYYVEDILVTINTVVFYSCTISNRNFKENSLMRLTKREVTGLTSVSAQIQITRSYTQSRCYSKGLIPSFYYDNWGSENPVFFGTLLYFKDLRSCWISVLDTNMSHPLFCTSHFHDDFLSVSLSLEVWVGHRRTQSGDEVCPVFSDLGPRPHHRFLMVDYLIIVVTENLIVTDIVVKSIFTSSLSHRKDFISIKDVDYCFISYHFIFTQVDPKSLET